jgi:type I restriction enzyme S subunit
MARKGIYPPSVTPGIPKLGMKPAGWVETTFADVLQVVERKADVCDTTEYQLVTAKRNRGGIVPRTKLFGKDILTKTQFFIKSEDFLIAKRQIIHGACGVVPPELDGALVSNEYAALRVQDGLLLQFLNYYTHTVYFQQTCFQSSVGVDVEKMIFRLRDWLKYKVYLPPLPEQRKIAEILGAWDTAIALTEQLIAAKQQRKKALMQQLLTGQRRFREFAHSGRKQKTRFGEIPADWKTVQFQDIAKVNTETLGSKADPDHRYLYIDLSSVDRGTIVIPEERQRFADLPSRARRVLHKGDVIMATVRPNLLGFAVCDFEPQDVLCSTGFALISPQNSSDSEFIYQNLYTGTVLRQVHSLVTGSNYPAMNTSEVNKLKLLWPKSIEERKKIGTVLKACDTEINLLTKKLDALQRQKKGLMQQLLTGRVQVKV